MDERATARSINASMLEFLVWVSDRPRAYADVMEAWRTSCPRHSVWEDAVIEGLVRPDNGPDRTISLTPLGQAMLAASSR